MYGTPDENGQLALYNFGLIKSSWKKVAAMPKLLQRRADQIGEETGTTPNSCVVNFYASGDEYIAAHQDQSFSDCGGKIESQLPVVIDRVGAARDLCFHALSGDDIGKICMEHGDSYVLTGEANLLAKHSVPARADCGLCVTFSWRCVRNSVSPDGTFAVVNGQRRPLAYLERALEKEARPQLQKRCEERELETKGSKADLVGRLAAMPYAALRSLEVEVLAGGHTPDTPVAERVLRVQGAELARLMLDGGKVIENRKQLGLGWWALYVGKDRQWRDAKWAEPFKKVLDTVPNNDSLSGWYGHAVGMIHLSEYRDQEECHGYKWAGGEPDQMCHVVSHAISFAAPIVIKTPKMNQQSTWEFLPDEQALIGALLADGLLPISHDLRPISEAREEPARASGGSSGQGLQVQVDALRVTDTVKILTGPRAGALEIVTDVKAGLYEVDEQWFERSQLEFRF